MANSRAKKNKTKPFEEMTPREREERIKQFIGLADSAKHLRHMLNKFLPQHLSSFVFINWQEETVAFRYKDRLYKIILD